MAEIKIRAAKQSDCKAIMKLVHELAVYEKAPNEVTVDFNHFVESGFGASPVWEAWVAVNEADSVVGFSLCYIRYSTWKGQRLYLEDLLVKEEMRGHGIGKMLMDNLIAVAKERAYSGIAWQVLDWNEPAINFYKKFDAKLDGEWVNCSIEIA